jgi:ankyrin repeat protein
MKDLFASTMDLNAQRFCLPDLIAQMVKLLVIHDNVAQMANYVAQMSQLHAIRDNQHTIPVCLPNLNGAGADTPEQNSHDAGSELFQAASSGNVSMTEALLSATGTQSYINYTDGHGRTSFFKAAFNGHVPIVAHLMVARCSINLATATGSTPLLVTVKQGHTAIVSQLITVRCNVDIARIDGVTPFLMATTKGHKDVVKMLITARCDVNLRCE